MDRNNKFILAQRLSLIRSKPCIDYCLETFHDVNVSQDNWDYCLTILIHLPLHHRVSLTLRAPKW